MYSMYVNTVKLFLPSPFLPKAPLIMTITATFDIYTAWRMPKRFHQFLGIEFWWAAANFEAAEEAKAPSCNERDFCPRVCARYPPFKKLLNITHTHTEEWGLSLFKHLKHITGSQMILSWLTQRKAETLNTNFISIGFRFQMIINHLVGFHTH